MFIHIGNNNTVLVKDIIAILDKDTVESFETTKNFIERLIKKGLLFNFEDKEIKSYVIIGSDNKNSKYGLYTSSISSQALYQRINR